jgi:ABC-type transport system substrate-binding protein
MKTTNLIALSLSMTLLTGAIRAHAEFKEVSLLDMYDGIPENYLAGATAKKWDAFLAKAKPGGELSIGVDPLIRTLEVYDFVKGVPGPKRVAITDDLVYETLMIPDVRATENFIVRPHIAERVEFDLDSKSIRLTLSPHARFSDGSPVIAEDIIASWAAFKEATPLPLFTDAFEKIVEMTKADDGKILVRFVSQEEKALIRRAAFIFLASLRIVKPNVKGGIESDSNGLKQKYIGTGPYIITHANRYRVSLSRRSDYWANKEPQVKGLYNFSTVHVVAFSDPDSTRQGITGQLTNFHREINPTHFDELKALTGLRDYKEKVQDINYIIADGSARALFMNTQSDAMRDVNLRKAMLQAWDAATAEALFNDMRVTPSSPGAISPLRPRGLPSAAVRAVLEASHDPLKDEALKPYEDMGFEDAAKIKGQRPRLKAAMDLLKTSGYTIQSVWGALTLMRRNRPVQLKVISIKDRPDNRRVMLFTELLKKMGITVEFRMFPDLPQFQRALSGGLYDFAPASLALHRDFRQLNILYLRQGFHTDGIKSSLNRARLSSPAIDEALTKLKSLSARDAEYQVYLEVFFRALSAHIPFILLGEPVESHIFVGQDLCFFSEVPSDEIPKNLLSVKTGYFGCPN